MSNGKAYKVCTPIIAMVLVITKPTCINIIFGVIPYCKSIPFSITVHKSFFYLSIGLNHSYNSVWFFILIILPHENPIFSSSNKMLAKCGFRWFKVNSNSFVIDFSVIFFNKVIKFYICYFKI